MTLTSQFGQLQFKGQIRTAANMRLASCGVKCLNSSAVFQINFSAGLTVLCSEIPHERQAQKRWEKVCDFSPTSGNFTRRKALSDLLSTRPLRNLKGLRKAPAC